MWTWRLIFLTYELDFSHESGFYDEEFEVALFSAFEGKTIYYTLNGSEPDPIQNQEHTFLYERPIPVTDRMGDPNDISMIRTNFLDNHRAWREPQGEIPKAAVIRAALFDDSQQFRSAVATHTYFVGKNHQLPVISIATDPVHFFGVEGIYVPGAHYDPEVEEENPGTTGNFYERGRDWERPIHMEFFEVDGTLGFSQGAGARIHGAFTRRFPQKTLRIYARNDYGNNRVNYPLFGEGGGDEFRRFYCANQGTTGAGPCSQMVSCNL
ncbi:MAG: chitobiase/beta-hexosaminidase C-terminal domain-containing protein [Bacillus sp. (in: Bacteria)]|nr:chitobiase/beta-hexosaminidase C-terminal domain-containing protein [Bacillus sp. (in: firmicutes)]